MGGIRKKTSKRGTTFQRSKIVKKASETRKKNNRDARKSKTWKAKVAVDPGIPNNFPFKDQVLAELADAKQAAIDEKERRRLAQKAASKEAKALLKSAEDIDEDEESEDDEEEDAKLRKQIDREVDEKEYEDQPGILPVYGRKAVNPAVPSTKNGKAAPQLVVEEEQVPDLIDTELPTIQAALDKSDVVVEVLDARDPIGFRSEFLEKLVLPGTPAKGSKWQDKLILLLNKVDLVPREVVDGWLRFLRSSFTGKNAKNVRVLLFKASFVETPIKPGMTVYGDPLPRTIPAAIPLGKQALESVLYEFSREKKGKTPLNVVFMGQPNVGKSAVINTLLGRPSLPTAATIPGQSNSLGPTTKVPCEVALIQDKIEIRLIDTPGWEYNPPDVEDEDEEMDGDAVDDEKWALLEHVVARDMLTRNMGRIEKVKETLPLVKQIVNRANAQDLMLAYNVPHFAAGDVETFLISLARAQGRVRKRGDADVEAASKTILRDWSHNLLPYYTLPTKSELENAKATLSEEEKKVVENLKTRQEMRKTGKGLIRFKVPELDTRDLILDEEMVDDESDDEGDDGEIDPEDELEGDLSESGEEVEFSQDPTPTPSPEPESKSNEKKRKRRSSIGVPAAAPVVIAKKPKRVAFNKEEMGPVGRAEVSVGTSSKLKRKGPEDEQVREGKKTKRVEEQAEIKVVEPVKEKKEIKQKKTKKAAAVAPAPVAAPEPVVASGKKGKKTKAAPVTTEEGDKPFDFSAI